MMQTHHRSTPKTNNILGETFPLESFHGTRKTAATRCRSIRKKGALTSESRRQHRYMTSNQRGPMRYLAQFFAFLPAALKALNDNPFGASVLVTLGAFCLLAYIIHQLR